VISFVTNLEEESAKFYEKMAEKYPEKKETFLTFSKENKKYKTMVERAYYGVITDALEACFSFEEGLNPEEYPVPTEPSTEADYSTNVKSAVDMEKTIQKAYTDAATLSEGLMADVPQTFKRIAKKRTTRITELEP
jgi:rubrerythrin